MLVSTVRFPYPVCAMRIAHVQACAYGLAIAKVEAIDSDLDYVEQEQFALVCFDSPR
jgi:hypothetical protein